MDNSQGFRPGDFVPEDIGPENLGEPIAAPTEPTLANIMRRFAAFSFDCSLIALAGYLFEIILWNVRPSEARGIISTFPIALPAIYFIYAPVRYQQTLGQKIAGMMLYRMDYKQFGFGASILRYIVFVFGYLFFFVQIPMMLFTKKHQGLHDKALGTLIIYSHEPQPLHLRLIYTAMILQICYVGFRAALGLSDTLEWVLALNYAEIAGGQELHY